MDHIQACLKEVEGYFLAGQKQLIARDSVPQLIDPKTESLSYITKGYVRLFTLNSRKEEYTHIIYGPGDVYPLTWLIHDTRSNLYAQALVNAEVYQVSATALRGASSEDLKLANGLLCKAIEQYRIYAQRVDNLEYKYASERLAYRLLLLAGRFGQKGRRGVKIMPPMTHKMLGTMLNLSRESVSREMEKLIKRGLIIYGPDRQIIIPNPTLLAEDLKVPTVSPQNLN